LTGLDTGDGILELVEEVEEAGDLVEDESAEQEEVVEKLKVLYSRGRRRGPH
jgi:hypothetical protein